MFGGDNVKMATITRTAPNGLTRVTTRSSCDSRESVLVEARKRSYLSSGAGRSSTARRSGSCPRGSQCALRPKPTLVQATFTFTVRSRYESRTHDSVAAHFEIELFVALAPEGGR